MLNEVGVQANKHCVETEVQSRFRKAPGITTPEAERKYMNKSLPVETFTIQAVANGCIAIPAKKSHPLLTRLHGDESDISPVISESLADLVADIVNNVAPQNAIAVIEVRRFADRAEFDVCTISRWENAVALDLAPALKELGLEITARWLPDGRIVLPGTAQGQSWQRFAPDASQTMDQNLQSAAAYIAGLFPDRQNTYFSLADFLAKRGHESAGRFGHCLYKYTDCGPWSSFTLGEGEDIYYEKKKAWETQSEQQWWHQCTGIQIGSIVEGSDVSVEGRFLVFPFTEKELDDVMIDIEEEADFYWKRDNSDYYQVIDANGESVLYCQWVQGDDAPTGNFDETEPEMLALAIAAHEALNNPESNPLSEQWGRSIDYKVKVPIPGTLYFVQEQETPDFAF